MSVASSKAISAIGTPRLKLSKKFNNDYKSVDWILPASGTPIISAFDGLCAQYQFQPNIIGEADNMTMLSLLARDCNALAVMPDMVVKDEISAGTLISLYGITKYQ